MEITTNDIGAAVAEVQRLRTTPLTTRHDFEQLSKAYAVIYRYCEILMRGFLGCRCGAERICSCQRELHDSLHDMLKRFDNVVARGKAIGSPKSYLYRACRNAAQTVCGSQNRLAALRNFYTEDNECDDSESLQAFAAVAQAVVEHHDRLASAANLNACVRGAMIQGLIEKRFSSSDLKIFLRRTVSGWKLKKVAAVYRCSVAGAHRAQKRVLEELRDLVRSKLRTV